MRRFTPFEEKNFEFLTQKSIEFTLVQVTTTGLDKSILDATAPIRQYFKDQGVHNFDMQKQGQENKRLVPTMILDETNQYPTQTSLYRPVTKKGDPRMWPYKLKDHCSQNNIFAIICFDGVIYIINATSVDMAKACKSAILTPIKDFIDAVNKRAMSASTELANLLQDMAQEWHPADVTADTGIGRSIETLLGIDMNCSKLPDYKGIEIKSYREKRPSIRGTLFTQVPNWKMSALKSAKEIVQRYGYLSGGILTYQNTLRSPSPNSQSLALTLYQLERILAIEEKKINVTKKGVKIFPKVADVAVWQLETLHNRLLEKHHETFWVEVESKIANGKELFRPIMAEHTKNPIVSQFDNLLDIGYITVDLLLCRPSGHGDTVSFKIKKRAMPMLFPESGHINLQRAKDIS